MNRREMAVTRRKQQVMRQRMVLIILTVCVILAGVIFGSSILASGHSKASTSHASFKYYTSIQIEQGDTLWSIANTHMTPEYKNINTYITEVKELNQLGPDDIHAGQYLMIPYYSGEFH